MENNNFVREVPEGYREVLHLNAKDLKFGIIFNLIAGVIAALICGVAALLLWAFTTKEFWAGNAADSINQAELYFLIGLGMGSVLFFLYIVLHELAHGVAYKKLTGEKLTFGITWSAAFCGVPHIYVNRKASLIASATPLVFFSLLFIPIGIISLALTAALGSYISLAVFIAVTFVFAFHLGGCAGDMYVILLLSFKFKSADTLIRDTGPEQFFYSKE